MVDEYYKPVKDGNDWNWTWAQAQMFKGKVLCNTCDNRVYRIPHRIVNQGRELIIESLIGGVWTKVGTNPHLSNGWRETEPLNIRPCYIWEAPGKCSIWTIVHCLGVRITKIKAPVSSFMVVKRDVDLFRYVATGTPIVKIEPMSIIKSVVYSTLTEIRIVFYQNEFGVAKCESSGLLTITTPHNEKLELYEGEIP